MSEFFDKLFHKKGKIYMAKMLSIREEDYIALANELNRLRGVNAALLAELTALKERPSMPDESAELKRTLSAQTDTIHNLQDDIARLRAIVSNDRLENKELSDKSDKLVHDMEELSNNSRERYDALLAELRSKDEELEQLKTVVSTQTVALTSNTASDNIIIDTTSGNYPVNTISYTAVEEPPADTSEEKPTEHKPKKKHSKK